MSVFPSKLLLRYYSIYSKRLGNGVFAAFPRLTGRKN
jgi:hypothetical protein